jgi:hypothetical protein
MGGSKAEEKEISFSSEGMAAPFKIERQNNGSKGTHGNHD